MNINDWLDNANQRLANRNISNEALVTEDLPLALIMVRAVIDLHKPEQYDDSYSGATGYMCEACLCDDGVTYMEYPCPTVRAIENTLKEYT